jgi:hypothetical protein
VFGNIERTVAQGSWFSWGEDRWIESVAFIGCFPAGAETGPIRAVFQVNGTIYFDAILLRSFGHNRTLESSNGF